MIVTNNRGGGQTAMTTTRTGNITDRTAVITNTAREGAENYCFHLQKVTALSRATRYLPTCSKYYLGLFNMIAVRPSFFPRTESGKRPEICQNQPSTKMRQFSLPIIFRASHKNQGLGRLTGSDGKRAHSE